ncbi:MAG TPA: TonB-dependent receptor [Candidatus Cybelea sp.]|nr:TonB-dependent receptor [Candidatus Cybelea sp.]
MQGERRLWAAVAVALSLSQTPVAAQAPAPSPEAPPTVTLAPVEVIGTTPVPGTGIDRDKVPSNVQSLSSSDLRREGSPSLTGALNNQSGSISIGGSSDDPFQPDILYRGFAASPVLGTPQGLAVYQNGVRINEAFGDTVNWDLFPDVAIDRVNVFSANPVYGLNALGGALVVSMKNGFTYQGLEGELGGGSFGQRSASLQYGRQVGAFGAYLAGRAFDSDGWRQLSPDSLRQVYADVGARGERASFDISISGANNRLTGIGPVPVQELAVDRSLVFTSPQSDINKLIFVTLNGSYQATDALSLQGTLYRREFRQAVANGNTTNFTACAPANGLLCQSDATTPLTGPGGATIPDLSLGGTVPIGENDRESIHAVGTGGTLQTTHDGSLMGHDNNFVLGASIDHSVVNFRSTTEVGAINSALIVLSSGFFVDTPETAGFNATPVNLSATNDYYGAFVSDTFNITPALAVTASGRYNIANIVLADREGSNLSGSNRYARFNPAVGLAYKIHEGLTAYAGYAEGNRAPTPSEIECSDPTRPCVLPSSLSADPPRLKQVVSHTYEAGLHGKFSLPQWAPGRFAWNAGAFRTNLTDDIFGVATSISTGFFENIGATRRQGVETGLNYKDEKWSVFGSYSLVDATFRSLLTLPSPNNPFADANGNIHVVPGDRLPGIPMHRLKIGIDYRITPSWNIAGTLIYVSDQFFHGDESNQNPTLPGYGVVNLSSSYAVTENVEMFATVQNALNKRYSTFGTFGDPTGIGVPGIPAGAVTNGPGVDNRFESPAAPISVFGGVRMLF